MEISKIISKIWLLNMIDTVIILNFYPDDFINNMNVCSIMFAVKRIGFKLKDRTINPIVSTIIINDKRINEVF
jgi:hypothetical protein